MGRSGKISYAAFPFALGDDMNYRKAPEPHAAMTSPEAHGRLVEALQLYLVGPGAGDAFASERLPGWLRPSGWYLSGFLFPSDTPPDKSVDVVDESAWPAEEIERRAQGGAWQPVPDSHARWSRKRRAAWFTRRRWWPTSRPSS